MPLVGTVRDNFLGRGLRELSRGDEGFSIPRAVWDPQCEYLYSINDAGEVERRPG